MTLLPSPAAFLPDEALTLISTHAGFAEAQGRLAEEVVDLVYREGWFRLLAPKRLGGMALPLPQVVRLEEGLAYADGSLGWVVTLCSGAGWFGGFLPAGQFDQLFADPRLCIAGSGSTTGEARMVDGEYWVNGSWAYASGIPFATAYTANCVLWRDGSRVIGGDGNPVVRPFLFLPGEVKVRDDWQAMGLVATESHGFFVKDLILGAERSFIIDPAAATDTDPLYQYPFLPLAEATLAANLSGMAQHFLDCCEPYFDRRPMPEAVAMLAAARAELDGTRGEFYRALDLSWEAVVRGVSEPGNSATLSGERPALSGDAVFTELGSLSHQLAAKVRKWVDALYPYAGLGAAGFHTEINRVWRDLHTAGQHPLLVF
jgi:alkylation response protein AidB-like acyl-CoA dehydrogenase